MAKFEQIMTIVTKCAIVFATVFLVFQIIRIFI